MSRRCSRRGSVRHAEDLVVAAGLVGHPEHADRAAVDQAAGERRLLQQHQRVERVAVEAEGVLDVAVVGGVLRRGEQHPVEADPAALVVDLVLVALPLGISTSTSNSSTCHSSSHVARSRTLCGPGQDAAGPVSRTMTLTDAVGKAECRGKEAAIDGARPTTLGASSSTWSVAARAGRARRRLRDLPVATCGDRWFGAGTTPAARPGHRARRRTAAARADPARCRRARRPWPRRAAVDGGRLAPAQGRPAARRRS